jgi:periplasmic protein TonB
MSFAVGRNRWKECGSVAVTVGLHVVVAYVGLTLTGVVPPPTFEPGPISTEHIPEIQRPEPVEPPKPVLEDIAVDVRMPVVEVSSTTPDVSTATIDLTESVAADERVTLGTAEPVTPVPEYVAGKLDARFLARFQPPYPPASRRAGEEGSVVIAVTVGPDGRVISADIAASSGYPRLDAAAIAQARSRWRFLPARLGDEAVESRHRITVTFVLNP